MKTSKNKPIPASEFDKKFDTNQDILTHLDLSSIKSHHPSQKINLDIPLSILKQIDSEATRIGVARTALIKVWLSERLHDLTLSN